MRIGDIVYYSNFFDVNNLDSIKDLYVGKGVISDCFNIDNKVYYKIGNTGLCFPEDNLRATAGEILTNIQKLLDVSFLLTKETLLGRISKELV